MGIKIIAENALEEMLALATSQGVAGVAAIQISEPTVTSNLILWRDNGRITRPRDQKRDDPAKGVIDTGTNYLALALAKLAEALHYERNSGLTPPPLARGEWGLRGCVFGSISVANKIYFVAASFSGGREDQDVEFAKKGWAVATEALLAGQ